MDLGLKMTHDLSLYLLALTDLRAGISDNLLILIRMKRTIVRLKSSINVQTR